MSREPFDYGGDDDSPSRSTDPLSELDAMLGTSGAEPRQRPAHSSLLAELDMRVIIQVVVAVVLIAVVGGLLARDAWARHARDTAFRQMMDANDRRDYLRVIQGAEKFLTNPPRNDSSDARKANVVSLYSEALMHWVAQQPGKLDANAHAHIARYKQLVKITDK